MSTRAQQNKIILESPLSFFSASAKNRLAPVTRLAITMMRTRWQHFPEFLKTPGAFSTEIPVKSRGDEAGASPPK